MKKYCSISLVIILMMCLNASAQMTGGQGAESKGGNEFSSDEYRKAGFIWKVGMVNAIGTFGSELNPAYSLPESVRNFGQGASKGVNMSFGGFSYFGKPEIKRSMLGLDYSFEYSYIFSSQEYIIDATRLQGTFGIGPLYTVRLTKKLYTNVYYNIGLGYYFNNIDAATDLSSDVSLRYNGLGIMNRVGLSLQANSFILGFDVNFAKVKSKQTEMSDNDTGIYDTDPFKLVANQNMIRVYIGVKAFKPK
jgi:hypothetical protein